ncbi:hypothetical protein CsSME_00018257 [Camellia sinensis var. sinensis]
MHTLFVLALDPFLGKSGFVWDFEYALHHHHSSLSLSLFPQLSSSHLKLPPSLIQAPQTSTIADPSTTAARSSAAVQCGSELLKDKEIWLTGGLGRARTNRSGQRW